MSDDNGRRVNDNDSDNDNGGDHGTFGDFRPKGWTSPKRSYSVLDVFSNRWNISAGSRGRRHVRGRSYAIPYTDDDVDYSAKHDNEKEGEGEVDPASAPTTPQEEEKQKSAFHRRLDSLRGVFTKNNLVQRLLPTQFSLDDDKIAFGKLCFKFGQQRLQQIFK